MALGEQSPEVDIDSIAMNIQAHFAHRSMAHAESRY